MPFPPERRQHFEEFADRVIIAGDTGSVRDLCLYWALRYRLPSDGTFPMWVPLQMLEEQSVGEALVDALQRPRQPTMLAPDQGLRVLSHSVSEAEARQAFSRLGIDARVETDGLDRYFSSEFRAGTGHETVIYFHERRGQVSMPNVEPLDRLLGPETLAVELEIPNLRLPNSATLSRQLYGSSERISRTGVVLRTTASKRRSLLSLYSPTWWGVLEAIFNDAGFTAELSDKSKLALVVLDMLGGIDKIDALASSRIFGMLARMATAKATKQDLPFLESRRPDLGPGELAEFLDRGHRDPIIRWLLERRIVVRGARVTCPQCHLGKWYEFERLQPYRFRSDGCLQEMMLPVDVGTTTWRYRINELFARAFDQGVFPVLLTILACWDPWQSPRSGQTLGFFPGVVLKRHASDAQDAGDLAHVDVDFIELFEGRLIIGECKVDANGVNDEQLRRYGELGRLLDCSRLVVSSIVPISQASRVRIEETLYPFVPYVDIICCRDLTDRTPYQRQQLERSLAATDNEPDAANEPGDRDKYIEHLLKHRIGHEVV